MTEPPDRYLTPDRMDVAQLVRHTRGERIENPEYVKARNEALIAAGLEPDPDPEKPIARYDETATVQDHINRIQQENRR